jgi:asparagine synthetase B (glutamine-hydrolysing)
MECIGRQSRLVTNQQRAYDFVGYEWRLPLWSEEFLDFWERVPPQYKVRQRLYKDVLAENNWGGVWKNIDVNKKLIRPNSLRIIRLFIRILVAPFGKKAWHRVEKNIFYYWMHQSYAVTVVPYWKSLFDRIGQRNINSWTANQFIKRNGFKGVLHICKKVKNI